MASKGDIRAVRKVLYDEGRTETLTTEMESIVTLMNFDPGQAIPPDDPRIRPGAGPTWYIAETGKINASVLEAADRCDRIAQTLTSMKREVSQLDIDRSDRRRLEKGLEQLAKGWKKRGAMWRDTGRPQRSLALEIAEHERTSAEQFKPVDEYLEVGIR